MAQINEAWHVLSDPGRRAVYDASQRSAAMSYARDSAGRTAAATSASPSSTAVDHRPPSTVEPARFPWRFLLIICVLGIALVLVNAALTKPAQVPPPDNLVGPGSCVDIDINGDAREVVCDGTNDGVVDSLIELDGLCPSGTEGHRDRQGLGLVCVRMSITTG